MSTGSDKDGHGFASGHSPGSVATRFGPENRPGKTGFPKGTVVPSGLHAAMMRVARQDESQDRTHLHKEMRQWLKDDRKAFMAKLTEMDKAHQALKAASRAASPDAVVDPGKADDGEEKVTELAERLLKELAT